MLATKLLSRKEALRLLLRDPLFAHLRSAATPILAEWDQWSIKQIALRYGFECQVCRAVTHYVYDDAKLLMCRSCHMSFATWATRNKYDVKDEQIGTLWLTSVLANPNSVKLKPKSKVSKPLLNPYRRHVTAEEYLARHQRRLRTRQKQTAKTIDIGGGIKITMRYVYRDLWERRRGRATFPIIEQHR